MAGRRAAFTIDGPRGPRYVAKPGPVILARKTGVPIYPFHIGVDEAWTLEKTWDQFQVPQPFSRAVFVGGPFIWVPADADASAIEEKHSEMQRALERVRDVAETWFRVGTGTARGIAAGVFGILECAFYLRQNNRSGVGFRLRRR